MKIHKILSKKQDNGLWGTPLNLHHIETNVFLDFDKQLIVSAIIIKFSELYDVKFKCIINKNNILIMHEIDHSMSYKTYSLPYDEYRVIDNNLYYLETDDDKLEFSRMMKLNKIKSLI